MNLKTIKVKTKDKLLKKSGFDQYLAEIIVFLVIIGVILSA